VIAISVNHLQQYDGYHILFLVLFRVEQRNDQKNLFFPSFFVLFFCFVLFWKLTPKKKLQKENHNNIFPIFFTTQLIKVMCSI